MVAGPAVFGGLAQGGESCAGKRPIDLRSLCGRRRAVREKCRNLARIAGHFRPKRPRLAAPIAIAGFAAEKRANLRAINLLLRVAEGLVKRLLSQNASYW